MLPLRIIRVSLCPILQKNVLLRALVSTSPLQTVWWMACILLFLTGEFGWSAECKNYLQCLKIQVHILKTHYTRFQCSFLFICLPSNSMLHYLLNNFPHHFSCLNHLCCKSCSIVGVSPGVPRHWFMKSWHSVHVFMRDLVSRAHSL